MNDPESTYEQSENAVMRAVVESVTDIRGDIRIFHLRPVRPYVFGAGQYAYIGFNGKAPRPYSIASRPGEDVLEIHIKRGCSDISRHIMDEVKAGDTALLSGPKGYSVYSCAIGQPILALAGGLGVAPLKSIIDEAIAQGHGHPITLYWGTANTEGQYLKPYFESLAAAHDLFTFKMVTGGAVTEAALADISDLSDTHVFLSGSPAMISHATPLLLDKKANRSKISYDQHPEAGNLRS